MQKLIHLRLVFGVKKKTSGVDAFTEHWGEVMVIMSHRFPKFLKLLSICKYVVPLV